LKSKKYLSPFSKKLVFQDLTPLYYQKVYEEVKEVCGTEYRQTANNKQMYPNNLKNSSLPLSEASSRTALRTNFLNVFIGRPAS
jgi:hypothetical protein